MKAIFINNTLVSYIIRRTTKKKIYIRVKGDLVVVSATKFTPIKEIESLLVKHSEFILNLRFFIFFLSIL